MAIKTAFLPGSQSNPHKVEVQHTFGADKILENWRKMSDEDKAKLVGAAGGIAVAPTVLSGAGKLLVRGLSRGKVKTAALQRPKMLTSKGEGDDTKYVSDRDKLLLGGSGFLGLVGGYKIGKGAARRQIARAIKRGEFKTAADYAGTIAEGRAKFAPKGPMPSPGPIGKAVKKQVGEYGQRAKMTAKDLLRRSKERARAHDMGRLKGRTEKGEEMNKKLRNAAIGGTLLALLGRKAWKAF